MYLDLIWEYITSISELSDSMILKDFDIYLAALIYPTHLNDSVKRDKVHSKTMVFPSKKKAEKIVDSIHDPLY